MEKYFLQFQFCNGVIAEASVRAGQNPYQEWATYADLLLTGGDLKIEAEGVGPEDHVTKVVLGYNEGEDTGTPFAVSSMFLLCEHDIVVEKEERVASRLLLPQATKQTLVVPR